MDIETAARLARVSTSIRRDTAVAELTRLVEHLGPKADADVIGTLAGWLVSCNRRKDADELVASRLMPVDPWRANLELLMMSPQDVLRGRIDLPGLYQEGSGREPLLRARFCIAAGKAAAIEGDLHCARDWYLQALRHGREAAEPATIAAGLGMLGNVFLVGRNPVAALDLYTLDSVLLSSDGAYLNMMRVYRAQCYMQLKQFDVARGLFTEARSFADLEQGQSGKQSRALASCGLIWLELLGGFAQGDTVPASRALERYAGECDSPAVLKAQVHLARALVALAQSDNDEFESALSSARQLFAKAKRLKEAAILGGRRYVARVAPACPDRRPNVCDRWLRDESIAELAQGVEAAAKHLADRNPQEFASAWVDIVLLNRGQA